MSYQKTLLYVSIILMIIMGCIIIPASAFENRSGDTIVIDEPIDDDLLASGGSMIVNAPVKSITWAGGTLIVNEPVETNVIAAGGTIVINAPVGVDLLAAGGSIDINSDVGGKVMVAGGSVSMNGNTENIAASGGTVILGKNTIISRDAIIGSSGYTTQGIIKGNLTVESDEKEVDYSGIGEAIGAMITLTQIIFTIGLLILGVILIKIQPEFFSSVFKKGREAPLPSFIAGILVIFGSFILCVILLITIIGVPISIFIGLLVCAGILISSIISGGALGGYIFEKMDKENHLLISFISGFIILNILFFIPILGFVLWVISLFIGSGALFLKALDSMNISL